MRWNASDATGLVLATPGLVDALIVGGGGGGSTAGTDYGDGAYVIPGLWWLEAGRHPVVVGPGGARSTGADAAGGLSSLGSLIARGAGAMVNAGAWAGAQFNSAITGTMFQYAIFGQGVVANTGHGGNSSAGSSGTVIVRVPV